MEPVINIKINLTNNFCVRCSMVNVLEPLYIKEVKLKNRLVMPPYGTDLATDKGEVTEQHLLHYRLRAREIGLVIVEHSYVDLGGRFTARQIGIHQDNLQSGLERLVEVIHSSRSVAAIQINHSGGKCIQSICKSQPMGPSSGVFSSLGRYWREPVRALKIAEIKDLTQKFGESARRAVNAGFDAVEIHAAHGWLLSQFASPLTNKRTDQYGGSLENRFRFPLEVIYEVRGQVGPTFPVFYRLGADDFMEGGLTIHESKQMASRIIDAGIDVLDISGGICGVFHPSNTAPGFFIPIAEEMKKVVSIPVIGVGGFTHVALAKKYLHGNKVDLIAIGRALRNDPDWGLKAIAALRQNKH